MKRLRKILGWFSLVLLVLVGLALIFNEPIKNYLVAHNGQTKIVRMTKNQIAQSHHQKGQFDFSKVESISATQVVQAATHNDAAPLGKLAIPAVGLKLPIVKGLSDDSLSTGGGTMKPDQAMGQGNYALAGHYMTDKGALFSPLARTQIGQLMYITDLTKVYTYKVTYKQIVDPTSVWLIADKPNTQLLTLITCADGGTNRWCVQGDLVKTQGATKRNLAVFQ
ncbi:hypothetical protein FC83_GL002269 [Agrilactobacillus composti DSM 18527 = JCM 14202]|uniref:Sortase n=2 Tax=Agrilactobacillus TaxID=2767875 RepID=A0A0R1Y3I3_9LACO|nr:class A sortase [Agrilactobacillus composti]KRM36864.1 hypothetical protein FC83_GL002269 [Agrilactobacillus composti DSM 18527 = JCM 14202]